MTRKRSGPDTNYLDYTGAEHVVLGGTNPGNAANPSGDDILISGDGDDTLYGDGGNDLLDGGNGNDTILGGAGDDIITDSGGDDVLQGEDGNDAIQGGNGLNLILGGFGNDSRDLGRRCFNRVRRTRTGFHPRHPCECAGDGQRGR